jgi:hypothetical protein
MKQKAFFSFVLTLFSTLSLVADSPWKGPFDIFTAEQILSPAVGVDGSGNAVILATVSDDSGGFYTKGAQLSQGTLRHVHSFPAFGINPSSSAISVNVFGNAAAVWLEQNPAKGNHFVRNALLMNSTWTEPTTISSFDDYLVQNFATPAVYLDTPNRAIAAWAGQSFVDFTFHIQEEQITPHWKKGVGDLHAADDMLTSTVLAGSTSGKALAAWCQVIPDQLHASFYDGNTWAPSIPLSTDVFSSPSAIPFTAVAMNDKSDAVILWHAKHGGLQSIYVKNGSYGKAQSVYIPTSAGETFVAGAIDLDESGNAIAFWIMQNGGVYTLLANRYVHGIWTSPALLETTTSPLSAPSIGIDAKGNAYVVWQKTDPQGKGAVYCSLYNASENSFSEKPVLLSAPDASATSPRLSTNHLGSTTVVWIIEKEQGQAVQAIYRGSQPPQGAHNFTGKKTKINYLFQSELSNILTWSPSNDPSVTAYHLYRRGILIATIPAGAPLIYKDTCKSGKTFYQLTTSNSEGLHSPPLFLRVH